MAKVKGEHDSRTGAAVLECTDLAALTVRRPIERGYLVNAPQQRDIWMHTLTQVMPPQGALNNAISPFQLQLIAGRMVLGFEETICEFDLGI